MNRRDLVRTLAAGLAIPAIAGLDADGLFAAGRRVHRRAGRAPGVLDTHQRETVATIAELIIPTTDTPGARAAGVDDFIDLLLAEWSPEDERARFLTGLADVDARARAAFGSDFLAASEPQRLEVLRALDTAPPAGDATKPDAPHPFFQTMKFLTVYGYCTSEVGATTALHYETIPGSYDPCSQLDRGRAAPGDF